MEETGVEVTMEVRRPGRTMGTWSDLPPLTSGPLGFFGSYGPCPGVDLHLKRDGPTKAGGTVREDVRMSIGVDHGRGGGGGVDRRFTHITPCPPPRPETTQSLQPYPRPETEGQQVAGPRDPP